MAEKCILYDDRVCNGCGECERCDLNPSKLCDNCGKCIGIDTNAEFRSISIKNDTNAVKDFEDEAINAFLDEPVELGIPEEIPVDPELAIQWEHILTESFKNDPMLCDDADAPTLRAVRKRSVHRRRTGQGSRKR
ncbi:MAG: hypothetical protein J1E60_01550 [Christensenellaceae bacterium]|nr:hypothetical protein [Christensenellaceae bacterium]